jgi:hypothetical protein
MLSSVVRLHGQAICCKGLLHCAWGAFGISVRLWVAQEPDGGARAVKARPECQQ